MRGSQSTILSNSWVFEILLHGNRGGGKSDVLLMDFAQHCGQGLGPDWTGIIFRQTFPQLQDLKAKAQKLFPRIFPGIRWVGGSEHSWTWPDGEKLLLKQFQRDDDYWKYHGWSLPYIGWDELVNWPTMNGYKRMISCCRSANPNVPLKIRATTNSYGPGHNVVKFYFELPMKDGIVRRETVELEDPVTGEITSMRSTRLALQVLMRENTVLRAADPGYLARIAKNARNASELAAWVKGSWDITSGGMFDDVWDKRYNVVRRFVPPPSWRIYRAFDWGSSRPFSVGWWAVSDGSDYLGGDGRWHSTVRGDVYRVAEWYGWNGQPNEGLKMLAVDVARGILDREKRNWPLRRIVPGPADSSIFDTENGVNIARDMAQVGVQWTRADKRPGSRINGWELMRKMIRAAQPEENNPRENPGLFVCENCDQFLRTVPSIPRDDKKLDDVNSDTEDHCFVGDTLVDTPQGQIAIKDLPAQGLVQSIDGVRPYFGARKTRTLAKVVDVVFEDGRSITCTPDHKFLTNSGWQKAVDLLDETRYVVQTEVNSLPINTKKRPDVRGAVRVVEIRDAGYADVYCLTVPETHAFTVNGGIVVHNCADESRYFCRSMGDKGHSGRTVGMQ